MDLNIRGIEDSLIRQLKHKALDNGRTLRDECIARLGVGLGLESKELPPKVATGTPKAPVKGHGRDALAIRTGSAPVPQSNIRHALGCKCGVCKPSKVRPLED